MSHATADMLAAAVPLIPARTSLATKVRLIGTAVVCTELRS